MRTMKLKTLAALLVLFVGVASSAEDPWQPLRFLVGTWTGEGDGAPGQGTGSFSFHLDLQDKVLIRKNRADYPATKERPALSHEDLMVIYPEERGKRWKAVYFDNEGHVIHYSVELSKDQEVLTFLSNALPSAPRFRLTYTKEREGKLAIRFEIAPPGKPDGFSTYLEAVARKR